MKLRRWFYKCFRTRVSPGIYNHHAGRILTTDEWEAQGGWDGALRLGWQVERPDWWSRGRSSSGVTDATVEEARARLDDWQDEMAAREN
jgi:hypothetical protein